MDNKVRLNAYITKDVKNYIDSQCSVYGVSQGSFISFVVMQYKKQEEALSSMKKITNSDLLKLIDR